MIEEQFMGNPILHDPSLSRKAKDIKNAKDDEDDGEADNKGEHEQFTN